MIAITNFDTLNTLRTEAARTGHGSKSWIQFATAMFDAFPSLYETAKRMNAAIAELRTTTAPTPANHESAAVGVLGDFVGQWIDADHALPDSDTTVVINVLDSAEPVWLGFYDGECWRNVEGFPVTVAAWSDMPEPIQLQPIFSTAQKGANV